MTTLLQQFEKPVGAYLAYLHGRERADGTWEAWIEFEHSRNRKRAATPVETTQANAQAVLYWATGLGQAYFEGALRRALAPAAVQRPMAGHASQAVTRDELIAEIGREILELFRTRRRPRLLGIEIFDAVPHERGNVVRAFEHLEKTERLVVRRTQDGNDWILLTEAGLRAVGLEQMPHGHDIAVIDPPKSAR